MSIELCKYSTEFYCSVCVCVCVCACMCVLVGKKGGQGAELTFASSRPLFFTTEKQLTEIDEVPSF